MSQFGNAKRLGSQVHVVRLIARGYVVGSGDSNFRQSTSLLPMAQKYVNVAGD